MPAPMKWRSLRRRVALLLAGALFAGQMVIAAHACAKGLGNPAQAAATAMPDCDGAMDAPDAATPALCAEHCKQGQQSDRASPGVAVSPVLASVRYPTAVAPEPRRARAPAGAWLSALVAASPPHAIAHCVRRT